MMPHLGNSSQGSAWRRSLRLTPFNPSLFCGILDFADAAQPEFSQSAREPMILPAKPAQDYFVSDGLAQNVT